MVAKCVECCVINDFLEKTISIMNVFVILKYIIHLVINLMNSHLSTKVSDKLLWI